MLQNWDVSEASRATCPRELGRELDRVDFPDCAAWQRKVVLNVWCWQKATSEDSRGNDKKKRKEVGWSKLREFSEAEPGHSADMYICICMYAAGT